MRIAGKVISNEVRRRIAEIKSIILRSSPLSMNILFNNNRLAQKTINGVNTLSPKASIRKANAEARSIPPRILTKTINFLKEEA
jgi:hypothetical protein